MSQPLASFRGVPFHVSAKSGTVGRRVIIDEYPLRDTPSSEDLGRKARRFALDGYVVGPTAPTQRDALIRAVERPGDGVLIHPDFGRLVVVCEDCDYSETHDGGAGRITFRFVFVEAGAELFPTGIPAAVSAIASAAEALRDGALEDILSVFDAAGSAFQAIGAALQFDEILDDLEVAIALPLAALEDAFAVAAALEALRDDAAELVLDVEALAARVLDFLGSFDDGSLRATLGIPFTAARTVTPGQSPAETQDRTNRAALCRYVSRAALAELGTRAQSIAESFETLDDAEAFVAAYAESCSVEELDDVATSAETHAALVDLRAAVSEITLSEAADEPRLEDLAVGVPTSSVVLAFELYGDPERGREIVERNRVMAPLFTAGDLRVFSR
jgi:prophage DNA circulation protein